MVVEQVNVTQWKMFDWYNNEMGTAAGWQPSHAASSS